MPKRLSNDTYLQSTCYWPPKNNGGTIKCHFDELWFYRIETLCYYGCNYSITDFTRETVAHNDRYIIIALYTRPDVGQECIKRRSSSVCANHEYGSWRSYGQRNCLYNSEWFRFIVRRTISGELMRAREHNGRIQMRVSFVRFFFLLRASYKNLKNNFNCRNITRSKCGDCRWSARLDR